MALARLTSLKPVGARSGGSITPMEEISDWPENNSVWAPATVRKMLGCPASAVESSTIPTTCRLREPTSMVAPIGRSMVLDTAASCGSDGDGPPPEGASRARVRGRRTHSRCVRRRNLQAWSRSRRPAGPRWTHRDPQRWPGMPTSRGRARWRRASPGRHPPRGVHRSGGLHPEPVGQPGQHQRHREHQSGADDRDDDESALAPLQVAKRGGQHVVTCMGEGTDPYVHSAKASLNLAQRRRWTGNASRDRDAVANSSTSSARALRPPMNRAITAPARHTIVVMKKMDPYCAWRKRCGIAGPRRRPWRPGCRPGWWAVSPISG